VLGNCAFSPEGEEAVATGGCVAPIAAAMRAHPGDAAMQEEACDALLNLVGNQARSAAMTPARTRTRTCNRTLTRTRTQTPYPYPDPYPYPNPNPHPYPYPYPNPKQAGRAAMLSLGCTALAEAAARAHPSLESARDLLKGLSAPAAEGVAG